MYPWIAGQSARTLKSLCGNRRAHFPCCRNSREESSSPILDTLVEVEGKEGSVKNVDLTRMIYVSARIPQRHSGSGIVRKRKLRRVINVDATVVVHITGR